MIVADTSVWADHIRRGNEGLSFALSRGTIVTHDFVLGELPVGHIRRGSLVESLLFDLARVVVLPTEAVVNFVRLHRLSGAGIGWIDAHLLASAAAAGAKLWTLDKRLATQARRLRLA